MTAPRRNLVISPIGDDSVHASWLVDASVRKFDVLLIYYGDQGDFGRSEADHYLRRKGFKWELINHVAAEHFDILQQYDRIWCPDCDIRADTATVNRLFALVEKYRLRLAQPAIAAGEISYKILRKRRGVVLRYTPYVEVMCPVFTRDGFMTCLPTFLESRSGWGLDWVWPKFFGPREMGLLDGAAVEHTGQLFRGENYQNLAKLGIDPRREFEQVMARHGGLDRRVHRQMVKGRVKLPAVSEPGTRRHLPGRLLERLGLRALHA